MKTHTLIIDQKTVKRLISMKEAIKAVEKGFKDHALGKTIMPSKVYVDLKKYNGDMRAMPVYDAGIDKCGIKWVNVHPDNSKKHLPTVMGLMILSDPSTGFPLAVMDATWATAVRTGAAGAVAVKYLARKNSSKVAFVGTGAQALTQFTAIKEVIGIKEISLWGKKKRETMEFSKRIDAEGIDITISKDIRECVSGSDIVVATTPSCKPIIRSSWIKEGVHVNAIGADAAGKQELQPDILKRSRLIVDSWEQASHSGEINVPLKKSAITKRDIYAEIGELAAGKKEGRRSEKEITVFDSTGLAVQDIVIADLIYRKAVSSGAGRKIRFI